MTRARAIHGDKYNYDKVILENGIDHKEVIGCPDHGDFTQSAQVHINLECGCPACGGRQKSNTEEFIQKSKAIYGNKYGYTKVVYINNNTKVNLDCFRHGVDFWQRPSQHIRDHEGCILCDRENAYSSLSEFIEKAKIIHGPKYDYAKFVYTGSKVKGIIGCICCEKDFPQSPASHLQGHGCPQCGIGNINEHRVYECLRMLNITIISQYAVIINDKKHRFDFYIPALNLIIEYQGVQHYKPVNFASNTSENIELAKVAFIDRQQRDEEKQQYCLDNNIRFEPIDGRTIHGKEKITKYLDELFERLNDNDEYNI